MHNVYISTYTVLYYTVTDRNGNDYSTLVRACAYGKDDECEYNCTLF